jgi:hypothetical protein
MLTSNNKNFIRDITLLIIGGTCSYILDLTTSKNLYKNCMTLAPQIFILFHHYISIFSLFAWLSNNKYILIFNIILILCMFAHWMMNGNVCEWTRKTKEQCGINEDFRSIIKVLFPNFGDENRTNQILYLTFSLIISIIKLTRFNKS